LIPDQRLGWLSSASLASVRFAAVIIRFYFKSPAKGNRKFMIRRFLLYSAARLFRRAKDAVAL